MSLPDTKPASAASQSQDSSERAYVLWIVSTLALLILISALALLGSGRLHRQVTTIDALGERLARLEQSLAQLNARVDGLRATPRDAAPRRVEPTEPRPSPPTQPPATRPTPPERTSAEPTKAPPGSDALTVRLERLLRPGDALPFELTDRAAAGSLLTEAARSVDSAVWTPDNWSQLAVLATLLGRTDQAEAFAARAASAGKPPQAYRETVARQALSERRFEEARAAAQKMLASAPTSAVARLLLADALVSATSPEAAAADELLTGIADPAQLSAGDRVRLGELWVALERWDRLEPVVAALDRLPPRLAPRRDLLRAIRATQAGDLVKSVSMLDELAQRDPNDFDVQLWRGVALLQAHKLDAAREALAATERWPQRPEGWFWRGMAELNSGNSDAAGRLFETALTAAPRYAPAWEALAKLALDRRDIAAAVQNLTMAVQAAPRRATAWLLLAIAHAKASRRPEAEAALRRALELDAGLLAAAKGADVLTRLFEAGEIDQMVGAPTSRAVDAR